MWLRPSRMWGCDQHAQERFVHAECDFDTNEYDNARVWFLHEECNFHTHCDFDTLECDYDIHDCDFNLHKKDFYIRYVWVWFLYAEWSFHTPSDFDTHECDCDTYDCDLYTHSVILKHMSVIMTLRSVITKRTSVNYVRISWISTQCVWLYHKLTKTNFT
jgi:hypothetical protein